MSLEVAIAATSTAPSRDALAKLHKARIGNKAYPLVVVALSDSNAWLFGPSSTGGVTGPLDRSQALRLLQSALDEPNSIAATQRIAQIQVNVGSSSKLGITNSGLFASHHLNNNVPMQAQWAEACEKSRKIISKSGLDLVNALGFTAKHATADAVVLTGGSPNPRAVAVLLDEAEHFDAASPKYQLSPVAYGLKVATEQDVPWLILLRGGQIRLYPAKDGVGVGQRGQADTFFELDLALLADEDSGLLDLIFSASALAPGGSTEQVLKDSAKYATELGSRLKNRIYENVIPELSKAVAAQLPSIGVKVDAEGLHLAYRLTLRILFRLLFQAYAEDRGLLPYDRNERYTNNALKTLIIRDLIPNTENEFDSESQTLWDDLTQVWHAIDGGAKSWNVPAYNGGLFGEEEDLHQEGYLIKQMTMHDGAMGPALKQMFVDVSDEGVQGPVDFRSLSVREFGTIYEGLLESSLSLADQDLTVDSKGAWVPAKKDDQVLAAKGEVYFHSSSGERKATGSYFTPSIIVDHLLDRALDPALQQHFVRVKAELDAGNEVRAHEIFFDFRVADLAMGSGHFLVSAVDRIESAMRNFLVENNVPGVSRELQRLEVAAKEALGDDYQFAGDIDKAGLLRRQIARRCIYGLDINPLAVELSRLALWIHTFVPGLPMSSLDHGLVCANSLTGIGTIDEALEALEPNSPGGQISIFEGAISDALDKAKNLLVDAANADEANKQEVKCAAKIAKQARKAAESTKHLFDAAVAARLGEVNAANFVDPDSVREMGSSNKVQELVAPLNAAHMPYLFPEVFLRENPGFDVILGNPPFLNRLENLTRGEDSHRLALQAKFNKAGKGYVNYASLFLLESSRLIRIKGFLTLIQPESLLATKDSNSTRRYLASNGNMLHLWLALENVFEANVRTCAPVWQRGLVQDLKVERSSGLLGKVEDGVELPENFSETATWSFLISDLLGVPRTSKFASQGSLSELGTCLSGDFIGNFYDLSEFVIDEQLTDNARLMTVGLVDPLISRWGKKTTKFNKKTFTYPRIDEVRAHKKQNISRLLKTSMVPKVLIATQTKVLEAYPDVSGKMVASIPLLSFVPTDPSNLFRVTAMFLSPTLNARVASEVMGSGLVTHALKLSRDQVLALPLPKEGKSWNEAAKMVEKIVTIGESPTRQEFYEIGKLMCRAYGDLDDKCLDWWMELITTSERE
jgi:hypothetical protein